MNCDIVLLRFCFFFSKHILTFEIFLFSFWFSPSNHCLPVPAPPCFPSLTVPCHSSIALRPVFCNSCRLQLCTSFLCSLLVRYRYHFSLSLACSSSLGFFFSPLTFMFEVCLACWLSAFTSLPESHHPAPISPSSAVFPQRPPVTVCDEQWLFILKLHECVPFLHASAPVGVCDFTESSVCQMCEFACLTIKVKDGRVRSRNGYR